MTDARLTDLLAERVMGWTVGSDRFMTGDRRWVKRWRFRPLENLLDAFRLLEKAAPQEYSMRSDSKGTFLVKIRIDDTTGKADGRSKPRVITCAIASALGIHVESGDTHAL